MIAINNEIFRIGITWVEERNLSLAGGSPRHFPEQRRIEMKFIVEQPDVEDSYILPEQVAIDFLSFLQNQALTRGWNIVGSYRRFTEEEGLLTF